MIYRCTSCQKKCPSLIKPRGGDCILGSHLLAKWELSKISFDEFMKIFRSEFIMKTTLRTIGSKNKTTYKISHELKKAKSKNVKGKNGGCRKCEFSKERDLWFDIIFEYMTCTVCEHEDNMVKKYSSERGYYTSRKSDDIIYRWNKKGHCKRFQPKEK